jgi:L-amino acid N-acyltransferase YncA
VLTRGYEAWPPWLVERGICTAVAGMTLPDGASTGLHRAPGFEDVGTLRRVGWKHGALHDVAVVQRAIGTQAGA